MGTWGYRASFGKVALLVTSLETEQGRDVAVQSPSRGDKHVLQDRGKRVVRSSAEILFIDQSGLEPFLARYQTFRDLANAGQADIFTHPLDGSYRARIEGLSVSGSSEKAIRVRCAIIAEDEPQTAFAAGSGIAPSAGLEEVTAGVSTANTALESAGLSSTTPASVLAAVTSWTEATNLDSQEVFLGVSSLSDEIAAEIRELDLATDISRWAIYQALINLRYQLTRAAETLTADSLTLFEVTITTATPVLALAAEVYGAAFAADYAAKITQINRLRTPGRIPAGTRLKMPSAGRV